MLVYFYVFLGSGFGGITRYILGMCVLHYSRINFPVGTLLINITGCFLMGLLTPILVNKSQPNYDQLNYFILVGFLGGYTTFSTFSIDTLRLLNEKHITGALLNIFLSVFGCMLSVWLGLMGGTIMNKFLKI